MRSLRGVIGDADYTAELDADHLDLDPLAFLQLGQRPIILTHPVRRVQDQRGDSATIGASTSFPASSSWRSAGWPHRSQSRLSGSPRTGRVRPFTGWAASSPWGPLFRRLDALAVQDPGAGRRFFALGSARAPAGRRGGGARCPPGARPRKTTRRCRAGERPAAAGARRCRRAGESGGRCPVRADRSGDRGLPAWAAEGAAQ
jgi:hypothetical protein